MTALRMRSWRLIGALTAAMLLLTGAQAAAGTQSQQAAELSEVTTQVADMSWSCTIPSGYTYDRYQFTSNCYGQSYWYRVRVPADNMWSCTIPSGYTYDRYQFTSNCYGQSQWYRIRAV
ncbi:hypothetical protein PJ985_08930 [Streptomyces sp. ACA25]|uniref:hypothetical protein n=1 Tax=Streptomyces sp. ACA25 TaxID=3022596 RepID=UPI002307CE95|nr:hypothetical protein [Streptomyces sp. ACA25]MDB1087690.1 hypothetical protein [Streptomyces sp. ACA25]